MRDQEKTKEELLAELSSLRAALARYERCVQKEGERELADEELKGSIAGTRESEIRGLLEVSRAVLDSRGFEESARRLFDACRNGTGAAAGHLALLSADGKENEVLFLESGGMPCSGDPEIPMPIRGLLAEAYDRAAPVYDNCFMNSRWAQLMPPGHLKLQNVMFAPIVLNGKVEGVIGLANKPTHFTEDDARIATAFGDIAAIALQRARAEDALRQSEEKFRLIFHTSPDSIVLSRLSDGMYLDINEGFTRITGYTRDEVIGKTTLESNVWQDPKDREHIVAALRSTGFVENLEARFRTKDGRIGIGLGSARVLRLNNEDLILSVVRDITESKQAENALQEREEINKAIVEQAAEGIVLVDSETLRFVEFNDAACNGLGYSREEFAQLTLFDVQGSLTREEFTEAVSKVLETGYACFENRQRRKDGSLRDVLVSNKVIFLHGRRYWVGIWLDITGQKRMEEALRESELRLRTILQTANEGFWLIDNDSVTLDVNRKMCAVLGRNREEILGRKIFDFVDDENKVIFEQQTRLRQKGLTSVYEIALSRTDGSHVFCRFSVTPLFDGSGSKVGAFAMVTDITERKLAEKALKESQQQLADIIDFLPDATFVIDREGKVIAWNRAIEEMTGVNAEEMLGKDNYEYALPFYGERRPVLVDLVLASGGEFEKRCETPERKGRLLTGIAAMPSLRGRQAFLFGTASALYDSRGNVVGAIESIRDITAQKLMEEAVAKAEARYRDMFENSVTGMYQATMDGSFLNLNKAAAAILGYDSPEEVLREASDVRKLYVYPERRSDLLHMIQRHGLAREFEVEFFRKNKSVVWISLDVRAVRDESGGIAYMEGTASDITDRKLLRAQLEQAQKMEAIGTLAGGIAHDFNNILTPIIGYTELSLNMVPEDAKLSNNMRQVLLSACRARDLVSQILTFSRKTKQEQKPVQVSLIVKEAFKLLRSSLPSTIDMRQTIPQDAFFTTIMADPTQIHQVLMNLCANAAHAMRVKGG
ncbi:MAG TPA: PAS domain S-box protein, partial [Syntrophobacteraceae bacterium]|nr:PAS domain S-box protein [Syntrophobacteraceae bacterium]